MVRTFKKITPALLLFVLFFNLPVSGKIILPSVFSDNMVLQQNAKVAIWGWGMPGQTVKIAAGWNTSDTISVKVNNPAKWETTIQTDKAGGPYSIQLMGTSNITLNNVMLGEVWLCSGQSNMEMTFEWGIKNGEQELKNADYPNIRVFNVDKIAADYPQLDCKGTWTTATPETIRKTSALAYFFGRELQQKLDVPVGIIVSAWGGTPAEVWIEKSRIENNPLLNKNKYDERYDWWPDAPGALYNSMIAPLVPFAVAGTIWYQGEANRNNYPIYSMLMKTLIENWRTNFNRDLPFYFVQIAPFNYTDSKNSHFLREQQEIVIQTVPKTGMVVVSDLVDDINDIHPKDKLSVGKRLAAYALAEVYHQKTGEYKSPVFRAMRTEKNKLILTFNHATELKYTGTKPAHFLISGDNKNFVNADAEVKGNTVVLSSEQIKIPVAASYCFDDTTRADVFNEAGLPLAPFRTNNTENY
jgi:sialate O-acetylesterase